MWKLTVLLFVFLISCKEEAPFETVEEEIALGSFSGQVLDADGNGLEGASITTNPQTVSVSTNSSGDYEGKDIEAGFYKLYAKLSGYYDEETEIAINDGQEFVYNFVMQLIPPPEPVYSMTARSWSFNTSSLPYSHYLSNTIESDTFEGEFKSSFFYARSVTTGYLTQYEQWKLEISGERSGKDVKWASPGGSFRFEGEFIDEEHIKGVFKVELSTYHINESRTVTYSK